jgi:hypothetical protein
VCAEERRPGGAEPDLPGEVMGRDAVDADPEAVDPGQMVGGADGDAVVDVVAPTARAVDDVVVVKARARGAGRHRAAPAVAFEDGVAVLGACAPLGDRVAEEPVEDRSRRVPVEVVPLAGRRRDKEFRQNDDGGFART